MRKARAAEPPRAARRKRDRLPVQIKIGHGGTLDPLATGVLIVGIGAGTKALSRYLACTKTYETVLIFGVESDSFDVLGKVTGTSDWIGITREKVEEKLRKFRGTFMQRPPVFSARRVNGERLYDMARRGEDIPKEMLKEREVRVDELTLMDFWEEGGHNFQMRTETRTDWYDRKGKKRKRNQQNDSTPESSETTVAKLTKESSGDVTGEPLLRTASGGEIEPTMSGALPEPEDDASSSKEDGKEGRIGKPGISTPLIIESPPIGPAVRLRMTVTSGFYVRSLCHDLAKELSSSGVMAELVRTRQGEFELKKNVLEFTEAEMDEDVWGPKVQGFLTDWQAKEVD
jgi:tRNA pseudouridine55 synthase